MGARLSSGLGKMGAEGIKNSAAASPPSKTSTPTHETMISVPSVEGPAAAAAAAATAASPPSKNTTLTPEIKINMPDAAAAPTTSLFLGDCVSSWWAICIFGSLFFLLGGLFMMRGFWDYGGFLVFNGIAYLAVAHWARIRNKLY